MDAFPPSLEYYCPIDLDSSLMILWYDMVTLHSIECASFSFMIVIKIMAEKNKIILSFLAEELTISGIAWIGPCKKIMIRQFESCKIASFTNLLSVIQEITVEGVV